MDEKEKNKDQAGIYKAVMKSADKLFGVSSRASEAKRKKNEQTVYLQYLESIGTIQSVYANIERGGESVSPDYTQEINKQTVPSELRWIVGVGQFGAILCEGLVSLDEIEDGSAFIKLSKCIGNADEKVLSQIRWYNYAVDYEDEDYSLTLNTARQDYVNYLSAHPELVCITVEEYGNTDRFKLVSVENCDEADDVKFLAPSSLKGEKYDSEEIDGKTIRNHYHEERKGENWYSISFITPGAVFLYEANHADIVDNTVNPGSEMLAIRRADYLIKGTDLEKEEWKYNFIGMTGEGAICEYVKKIDDEHYIEVTFYVSPKKSA